ncbi:MAG TPA: DUF6585 family protein [Actinocrinis sp.]|nr:DUF6585 family protein [Actinocrinis sp.]
MSIENKLHPTAPTEQSSAQLAALVMSTGLGIPRTVYRPARQINLLVLGIVNILVPIPFLFTAAAAVGLVLAALLWPLGVLVLLRSPLINRGLAQSRVYVHDNGFIHARKADSMEAFRWDQITTVYQSIVNTRYNGVSTGTKYMYTITRADGRTVKLTQAFEGIGHLGRSISVKVAEAQLPATKAALAEGQKLWFGDVFVDSASVGTSRKTVPWSAVSDLQVRNGQISFVQTGKFLPLTRTRAAQIPNLPLFLHLARSLQGGAGVR